jgi:hypothetical protein
MNSIVEAKVKSFLQHWYHYTPLQSGTITYYIRDLARISGHDLDERFASAGLGAGPERSVAASLVDKAIGGGGCSTADYEIRAHCEKWLRETPPIVN